MSSLHRLRCSVALAATVALFAAPFLRAVESPQICAGQTAIGTPEWTQRAVIYEVNTRQYSAAGTFAAVEADLPRLHDLGVDVLWFMPIHPIGRHERKGSLGSPYAVRDYLDVNPEFGTAADFKHLVDTAHAISPLSTSTATRRPHGGRLHGKPSCANSTFPPTR